MYIWDLEIVYVIAYFHQGPVSLTWANFDSSMEK